jgi:hypothetical protein
MAYTPSTFGIATNLVHIKGGLRFMKQTMDATGKYTDNNYKFSHMSESRNTIPSNLKTSVLM